MYVYIIKKGGLFIMEKNLTYRSSSKGVAEQYGISLSKKMYPIKICNYGK